MMFDRAVVVEEEKRNSGLEIGIAKGYFKLSLNRNLFIIFTLIYLLARSAHPTMSEIKKMRLELPT